MWPAKKWTAENRQLLQTMWERGDAAADIATHFNLGSAPSVYAMRAHLGLKGARKHLAGANKTIGNEKPVSWADDDTTNKQEKSK